MISCLFVYHASVKKKFWSLRHRVEAVRFMHETGSVVATQRRFRIHFNVPRHGGIPSRKTILLTFGIVGPFFFENETGVTETVNSA